ncbi:Peroxisomal membrane protein 4 [Holothuria leucospilota]|uniref:Peroxisomal membrane protein 4 n=1 Tax=Holothuria leucospilota TaxID=206669 RepID=A0A9Q1CQ20_HOLLE|nr:Peroxisomal membrane protein 4 [Holothuria leucospilota]
MAASLFVESVNRLLASGEYFDILSIIKGLRNGAVYGVKVRFPHALVMTFLFGRGTTLEKFQGILQATYTHSKNLAKFVFLFKSMMVLLQRMEGKEQHFHPFIAGVIGGYLVFGENNKINSQINMYLLSRILFGAARLLVKKGIIQEPKRDPFPIFAAIVWGIVMWQFYSHKEVLQPSLQNSMTYLYRDSNIWNDIWDFLIYNKPGTI